MWQDTIAPFVSSLSRSVWLLASVFPNSKITAVSHYTDAGPRPAGSVMTVSLVLDGQEFTALNGGPEYKFTEAISLLINCVDQDEVDDYWEKLTAGSEEVACGWLKDRYGMACQVVPEGMMEVISSDDPARTQRAMQAMFGLRSSTWPPSRPPPPGARDRYDISSVTPVMVG
jgi:predicted 3-demethylubiquinone-9 3-methyltransferase (glyoxalase superfamily)